MSANLEFKMKRRNRIPSALKHGIYSAFTVLPGEDEAAFNKLREDLIAEYAPDGPSEYDAVEEMARLIWRRQNLPTYSLAAQAKTQHAKIYSALSPPFGFNLSAERETRSPEELDALRKQVDAKAKRELGAALGLVEMGEVSTTEHLLSELEKVERLDRMIERSLTRLLHIRGDKSLRKSSSFAASSAAASLALPPQSRMIDSSASPTAPVG
jgi:hypothetical protein